MGFTNWQERAEKAEAELVRLAKQEPVVRIDSGYTGGCVTGYLRKGVDANTVVGKQLYAAPVPAVAAIPEITDEALREQMKGAVILATDAEGVTDGAKVIRGFANRVLMNWGNQEGMYKAFRDAVQAPAVAAPAVPEEWLKCWLIERPASSEWPAIWMTLTTDSRRWASDGGTMYATGGGWCFTSAASEALKFAEKESADEYVRHNKIKDVVVTEHIFDNRALLQSAPAAPAPSVPEEWKAQILAAFPLLDDEGLCQEKHHCEWTLQQDRKRLHTLLQSAHVTDSVTVHTMPDATITTAMLVAAVEAGCPGNAEQISKWFTAMLQSATQVPAVPDGWLSEQHGKCKVSIGNEEPDDPVYKWRPFRFVDEFHKAEVTK